jgi:hypothetical protein
VFQELGNGYSVSIDKRPVGTGQIFDDKAISLPPNPSVSAGGEHGVEHQDVAGATPNRHLPANRHPPESIPIHHNKLAHHSRSF